MTQNVNVLPRTGPLCYRNDGDGIHSHVPLLSKLCLLLIIFDRNKRVEHALIKVKNYNHCWRFPNQSIIAFCGGCQWIMEG